MRTFSGKGLERSVLVSILVVLTVSLWMASPRATAQTDTFIAGTGMWSQKANWSLDAVPGQGNDCMLPTNSVVTSDLAGECANFSLATGGSLTLTPGYLFVYGSGFTNQGAINIGSGNGLAFAQPSVTATISGGGTIALTTASSAFIGSRDTVINTDNTIQGQGIINVTQFTNKALINANVPSATLQLHAGGTLGVTNTGTVEASNGGTLQLFGSSVGVPFNNTGGTIQALAGSTVVVDAYAISGGMLISTGSGAFTTESGSGNPSLSNLTNNANFTIVNGGSTTIGGTITNQGAMQAKGTLFVSGNATLKGGSVAIAAPSGTINALSGAASLINQSDIAGSGVIGDAILALTNQGTINATDPANPLSLVGQATNNTATLEASGGGTLQIENTVNNLGGTVEAQTGSLVLLNTATINGGRLTTTGTGTIQSENATLDGTVNVITNAGLLTASGFNLNMKGTINNTGTIALSKNGGCIALTGPTTLSSAGKVTMTSSNCILGYSASNTLTNQSTIEGAGTIGESNPMGIVNNGTILANTTKPLTIGADTSRGFTNNGKLVVNKGSALNIVGLFNNYSDTTLSGGTYMATGTLELQGAIATNAASVTLTGSTGQILNNLTNSSALAGLAANASTGSLSLQSGQVLTTTTNLSNAGKITVGSGSGFSIGGRYTQTAGTATIDGTLTASTGLTLQKGSLMGKGTLVSAVTSGASVTAGDSSTKPGKLTVTGSYTQESTGTLNISIGGSTAGTYGQVAVSNGVSLNGTLNIKLVGGFTPTIGETFSIVTGSAVSGQFATVKGLSINSSEHFTISYSATKVTLTVVSGP
jgi:hypothetical protein